MYIFVYLYYTDIHSQDTQSRLLFLLFVCYFFAVVFVPNILFPSILVVLSAWWSFLLAPSHCIHTLCENKTNPKCFNTLHFFLFFLFIVHKIRFISHIRRKRCEQFEIKLRERKNLITSCLAHSMELKIHTESANENNNIWIRVRLY